MKQAIAENNSGLLMQIQELVKSSVSDLKRSNESIASQQMSEIKRIKRDSVPHFKKKSNEDQFNASLFACIYYRAYSIKPLFLWHS